MAQSPHLGEVASLRFHVADQLRTHRNETVDDGAGIMYDDHIVH